MNSFPARSIENSAAARRVIRRLTRKPKAAPPGFATELVNTGSSGIIFGIGSANPSAGKTLSAAALKSFVPSPKYQEDTRRLGSSTGRINAA
jgi:hypothetical protein